MENMARISIPFQRAFEDVLGFLKEKAGIPREPIGVDKGAD